MNASSNVILSRDLDLNLRDLQTSVFMCLWERKLDLTEQVSDEAIRDNASYGTRVMFQRSLHLTPSIRHWSFGEENPLTSRGLSPKPTKGFDAIFQKNALDSILTF